MYIVAVDPGRTTGLACVTLGGGIAVDLAYLTDPLLTWRWISRFVPATGSRLIIEDFQAPGPISSHARHTIGVVGFLDYGSQLQRWNVKVVQPARRKAYLTEAKAEVARWNAKFGLTLPIHTADALAHALAEGGGKLVETVTPDDKEKLSELLGVNVSPRFKQMLEDAARSVNRSAAGFVRYHVGLAIGYYEKEGTSESGSAHSGEAQLRDGASPVPHAR